MKSRRAAAAAGLAVAAFAANAQFVVNEGFENVATLPASGWVLNNASTPLGPTSWFQGAAAIFPAFAGGPDSYIAANFNNTLTGGTIASFLFTPVFTTEGGSTVSFWARSAGEEGFIDQIRVGRTTGGTTPGDFIQVGSDITLTDTWTQYTFSIAPQAVGATGRAVIEYFGPEPLRNFVGVDNLTVAVPEPDTWALLAIGFGVLGAIKRRQRNAA
jgi:hypothetical protein